MSDWWKEPPKLSQLPHPEWPKRRGQGVTLSTPQTHDEMRRHLIGHHGCPADVVDAHGPKDWALWHRSEHKYLTKSKSAQGRQAESITHHHPPPPTRKKATK